MRAVAVLVALVVSACDVEASLGAQDGGTHDGAATLDASAIDASHGHDAALDAAVLDASDLDAGPADAGAQDVGLDAHPICATPDAGGCVQCQAAMCCAEYTTCAGALNCPCIVDCVFAGHTVAECSVHCGADHGESSPLITCAQHHCVCP